MTDQRTERSPSRALRRSRGKRARYRQAAHSVRIIGDEVIGRGVPARAIAARLNLPVDSIQRIATVLRRGGA